jgi:hypothetical protein
LSAPETRYVDFEPIKEPWNIYELRDGTKLRIRTIVFNVMPTDRFDEIGKPVYGVASANLMVARARKELRGQPSASPSTPAELADSIIEEAPITKTIRDEWNEYALMDGTKLKVKSVLISAKRTSKYDGFGEPIYLVNSSVIMDVDAPKELWRRP